MNFFERQDVARRKTGRLLVYFAAGYIMLTLAVYLAVILVTGLGDQQRSRSGYRPYELQNPARAVSENPIWNPQLLLLSALGTLAVVGIGSGYKMMELSQGGSAVATMLGGRPVSPQTTDPDERKLLNVIEEMSLASGIPVPQVFIMDDEQGINAFAAGHELRDSAVGVTRGAVRFLSRDELQGVIAHEFSHILNGDMRLNIRLIGLIFGIVCLAVIGRVLLHTRGRKNPLPILGLALIIIGWAGVFFGRIIQAAVSRQREYLADASAVQFTRNPQGLAGALKKIGGLAYGSRMKSPHATEASHLFFGNGLGDSFLGLMSTHPPLVERIRAIDPAFDGVFPTVQLPRRAPDVSEPRTPASRRPPVLPRQFPFPQVPPLSNLAGQPPVILASAVVDSIGAVTPQHIRYAVDLRSSIPPVLDEAARDPLGAESIIHGLLLSQNPAVRQKQTDELARLASPQVVHETLRLLHEVRAVALRAKLPLVDACLPALRQISASQFQQFRKALQVLTEMDGEIDLFEYVLQKMVVRHLEPSFVRVGKQVIQFYSLGPLSREAGVLLSAMAYLGHPDPNTAQAAFTRGATRLEAMAFREVPFYDVERCGLSSVDEVLTRFAQAAPQIKRNVLQACVDVVSADDVVQEHEAELLRAIADSLDCPMPPLLAGAQQVSGISA